MARRKSESQKTFEWAADFFTAVIGCIAAILIFFLKLLGKIFDN